MGGKLGVLPHYSEIPADRFAAAFPKLTIVGINLNQYSPKELSDSVPWAVGLAKTALARGRNVLWSVPFPGKGQMEAVNEGTHDDRYRSIADQILAAMPVGMTCYVRLPWEFNLKGNPENAMYDRAGKPAPALGQRAWRRLAMIFRCKSSRFRIVWSPDVERDADNVVDPIAVWPGVEYVDVIAPDMYLGYAFGHKPGDYAGGWFREPMLKLREFARLKGKPFGLSEAGADHDDFAGDVKAWLSDTISAPSGCEFVSWWDDTAVINCMISTGDRPALAQAVKGAFQ